MNISLHVTQPVHYVIHCCCSYSLLFSAGMHAGVVLARESAPFTSLLYVACMPSELLEFCVLRHSLV